MGKIMEIREKSTRSKENYKEYGYVQKLHTYRTLESTQRDRKRRKIICYTLFGLISVFLTN